MYNAARMTCSFLERTHRLLAMRSSLAQCIASTFLRGSAHASSLQEVMFEPEGAMCACMFACAQVLEVMWEDDVALCLTPQAFNNIHAGGDIFNNTNIQVRRYLCGPYEA